MAKSSVSRREFMKGAAVVGGGVLLAGCASEPAPAQEAVAESAPMTAMTAEEILTPLGMMPGSPDHAKGWTTELPDLPEGMPLNPPVTVTSFTRTDADTRFQGDDDIYDNNSLRYIKALFGIEYEIPWTYVQGDERDQKMNLAMAAGDIPDLMPGIGLSMFQDMVAGDLVADITDVYEATAHPKWVKESQEWGDHQLWAYAEVDGRKMAFPSIAQAGQDEQILFIREDWLEKVGMEPPTTLDELEAVGEAFVTNDLGAGPPGTTVALAASRDLQSWYGGLGPVFGGFGVLPSWYTSVSTFTKDGQGGLRFDGIEPALKDALALIRRWYEKKIISPDFFTKGYQENRTEIEGNRVGMNYTHPWGGVVGGGMGSMANDPNASWIWIDVPAGPVRKGKNYFSPLRTGVFPFRKGSEHIDKILKQANFEAEIVLSPQRRYHGFEGHNYQWVEGEDRVELVAGGTHGYGIIFTRGGANISPTSNMNSIQWKLNYKDTVPREEWDAMMELLLDDPTGLQTMQDEGWLFLAEHSLADTIRNEWNAAPTELQKEKWTSLQKLTDETYFAIITGQVPVDAFDEYVTTWKAQGGDEVLAEINEWWADKQ
jgi:putative aldouronate transport system substrate-binding protein